MCTSVRDVEITAVKRFYPYCIKLYLYYIKSWRKPQKTKTKGLTYCYVYPLMYPPQSHQWFCQDSKSRHHHWLLPNKARVQLRRCATNMTAAAVNLACTPYTPIFRHTKSAFLPAKPLFSQACLRVERSVFLRFLFSLGFCLKGPISFASSQTHLKGQEQSSNPFPRETVKWMMKLHRRSEIHALWIHYSHRSARQAWYTEES